MISAFHELEAAVINDLNNWQHDSTNVCLRNMLHGSVMKIWARAMASEHAGDASAASECKAAEAAVGAGDRKLLGSFSAHAGDGGGRTLPSVPPPD